MHTVTQLHPPHPEQLPQLSIADRAALRVGVALILWTERHSDRSATQRAHLADRSRAGREAEWHRMALLAPRR